MMNKNKATVLETIIYYDGPQVLLLETEEKKKVIAVAIIKEGCNFPFLGAEISEYQWKKYYDKTLDLRYLFMFPYWRNWYIFNLKYGDDSKTIKMRKATKKEYKNPDFLPLSGFYN